MDGKAAESVQLTGRPGLPGSVQSYHTDLVGSPINRPLAGFFVAGQVSGLLPAGFRFQIGQQNVQRIRGAYQLPQRGCQRSNHQQQADAKG